MYGDYELDYKIAADYDLLIKMIYKHKAAIKYLPLDVVTMRMGGVSTSGLKSNFVINKEIAKACRRYGIWTCIPLLYLRYFYKIFEFTKKQGR